MAINTIKTTKIATDTIAKSHTVNANVATLLIRVTGTSDVFVYFDNGEKSQAFIVKPNELLPPMKVNLNTIRFYSLAPSEISFLTWG